MEPRSIAESLSVLRSQLGIAPATQMDAVLGVWDEVAGRLATGCTPMSIRDSTLNVGVDDPALVQAVEWVGSDWCRRLGELVPDLELKRVTAQFQTR
ncbi:MAG: DUF721 domain-containing protein [Microthrixaceae bacterium]|nr:DUF721 domain-containing protein [Microthrixaceae bacterium]